jgi:hypothetical protein
LGVPKRRWPLVSFSVKSSALVPSQDRKSSPRSGCAAAIVPGAACRSPGRGTSPPHDQVLRNQIVGRTCRVAGSGSRLWTVIRIRMSSGEALAYSTKTSK